MSAVNILLTVQDAYRLVAILKRYLADHPDGEGTTTAIQTLQDLERQIQQ